MGQELELLQQLVLGMDRLNGDMQGMKAEMQEMKSDIQGMKSEIRELKSDMQEMKLEMQEIKQRQAALEVKLETEVVPNIKLIAENWLPLTEKVTRIDERVEGLSLTVDIIWPLLKKNAYDLERLKKAQ